MFLLLCMALPARAALAQAMVPQDLTQMSMEQLMNMEIFSAAKRPERVWDTAAAITVITPDDIRRSGATNLPELLRMVPGIRVEQVNANSWDISIRGFNGSVFANKLLVLIDGRSVYAPLHGGVFWTIQNVVLEDIDRIEIIRGPGGTLWGANAVNGVINIITKKAKETQGTLVSAGGGSDERGFSTIRYGGKAKDWDYRMYAKYDNYGKGESTTGSNTDNWEIAQGGFKAEKDKLTLQGDYLESNVDTTSTLTSFVAPFAQQINDTDRAKGWNLLANYTDDDWYFKTYWDVTNLRLNIVNERRDQVDAEYNRLVALSPGQQINWGANYHLNLEQESNTDTFIILKNTQTDQVFSLYVQDEYRMMDDKWKFTIGSKFEYNIYTHFDLQPNVRALFHINDANEIWAAASRAIRTPSRLEESGVVTQFSATSGFLQLLGNDDLASEKLRALELGYRNQWTRNLNWDLALFSDYYDKLSFFDLGDLGTTTEQGQSIITIPYSNAGQGEVHGAEISTDMRLKDWWKITAFYSFIKMDLKMRPEFTDAGLARALNAATPMNASYLRSSFDLPHGFEVDTTFRYTSSFDFGSVPSAPEVDFNISKDLRGWRVAVGGMNLVSSHHKEAPVSLVSTQVRHAWYAKLTHRF
jgi:iron complex outermembrane receptor protein